MVAVAGLFAAIACRPSTSEAVSVRLHARDGLHDLVAEVTGPVGVPRRFRWERDGQTVGDWQGRVPVSEIAPGQRWTVHLTTLGGTVQASATIPDLPPENVLVVVLDDIGVDKLARYGIDPGPATGTVAVDTVPTPTLDGLIDEGVMFRRAYTAPTCSPTRANLITGRFGRRTGAGAIVVMTEDDWELPLASVTMAEAVDRAYYGPWATAALGKWHLVGGLTDRPSFHPLDQGFDTYRGSLTFLLSHEDRPSVDGYFKWEKDTDGELAISEVYNTTDTTDDAIEMLATLPEPFLLYVAYNAAHIPLHRPPPELYTRPLPDDPTDAELFGAMVEALDTEMGRMLASFDPEKRARTTIVVIGDNGTSEVTVGPGIDPDRVKHTLFEGGIRVPLVVTGPRVAAPGSVCDAPVHALDVFATLAEIAGVPLTDVDGRLALAPPIGATGDDAEPVVLDGRSLLPLLAEPHTPAPRLLFTERFGDNGPPPYTANQRAALDEGFKVIRSGDPGYDQAYALPGPEGLDEGTELFSLGVPLDPAADHEIALLRAALDAWDAEVVYEGR